MGDPRGFLKVRTRRELAERPVEERIKDWFDVHAETGLQPWTQTQAARCMDCGTPFCMTGCPLGNLIPEWNDLVRQGKWEDAYNRLSMTNNFHGLRHGHELLRHYVREPLDGFVPVLQQGRGELRTGLFGMLLDQCVHQLGGFGIKRLEEQCTGLNGTRVDLLHIEVKHISVTAGEACTEVASGGAEHHNSAAGHVLAAVVAHAFDYKRGTAVTNAETFAGATGYEHLAGSGAETGDIAGDDVAVLVEGDVIFRAHDHATAGQALADTALPLGADATTPALGSPIGNGCDDARQPLALPLGELSPQVTERVLQSFGGPSFGMTMADPLRLRRAQPPLPKGEASGARTVRQKADKSAP